MSLMSSPRLELRTLASDSPSKNKILSCDQRTVDLSFSALNTNIHTHNTHLIITAISTVVKTHTHKHIHINWTGTAIHFSNTNKSICTLTVTVKPKTLNAIHVIAVLYDVFKHYLYWHWTSINCYHTWTANIARTQAHTHNNLPKQLHSVHHIPVFLLAYSI
jgi:hypothetical protein